MLWQKLKTGRTWAAMAMGILLLQVFLGCQSNSPVSPEASELAISRSIGESGIAAQSNIGPIWILDKTNPSFPKTGPSDSLLYEEKYIESENGGRVEIGDKEIGRSTLTFSENALPKDTTVNMHRGDYGNTHSSPFVFEFGPEGTIFNNIVTISLTYQTADLNGVPEDNLRIFYYNSRQQMWELIGGSVDKENKIVTAEIEHFSRYAIAFSK